MIRDYSSTDTLTARSYAAHCHRGQQRRCGSAPYMEHVDGVARRAKEAGLGALEITVAYLHDLLEKTEATYDELVTRFGTDTADLVAELSNDMEEVRRRGKKEYLLAKMREMGPQAFTLKLCDLLDNAGWALNHCPGNIRARSLENYRYILENLPRERLSGVNAELAARLRSLLDRS